MLKLLLLGMTGLYSISAHAQITITNNQLPTAGTSVIMSNAQNDPAIDITTTGANQVWDYSGIVYGSQDSWAHNNISGLGFFAQFAFGIFAPGKYQATYYRPSTAIPVAQITSFLPVTIDSIFGFTKANVDSSATVGYGLRIQGNTIGFRSDSIEKNYDLTATFGDTWSSRAKTNFDFNPFVTAKFVQRRNRSSAVDGYGSITTPFGTFNAIRIKHTIQERDSLYYKDTVFGIPVNLQVPINLPTAFEYEWRALTEREAILRIKTSLVAGNETVTGIEYRDTLHYNAGLQVSEVESFVSPNPFSEQLTIAANDLILEAKIINFQGKVIFKENVNALGTTLYLQDLPQGMYLLEIETVKGKSLQRIVKK